MTSSPVPALAWISCAATSTEPAPNATLSTSTPNFSATRWLMAGADIAG